MTDTLLKVKHHKLLTVNVIFTTLSLFFNLTLGFKVLWFAFFLLVPLLLNEEDGFSCLLYFSMFSRIVSIKMFAVLICVYSFAFVLKSIVLRLKESKDLKIILYYFLCVILMLFYNLIVNKTFSIQFIYYLNFLNLIIIFAFIKQKFNKEMVLFYGYGLILVAVLSVFGYLLDFTKIPFAYEKELNLLRFTSLMPVHNGLGICCVIEILLLFNLVYKEKLPKYKTFLLIILLTIIGVLTFSKTFFLTIILATIYMIICLFIKSKNKKKFIFSLLGICLILSPIILIYFSTILTRFTAFFRDSGILDMLTNGRYGFWKLYLKPFTKNILTILFGVGVCYNFNTEYSSHSMYVSLISRLGIIGALLIVGFIVVSIKHKQNKKFNFMNYFPLMLMLLIFVVEDISFNTHNTIPFILSMFLLNYHYK